VQRSRRLILKSKRLREESRRLAVEQKEIRQIRGLTARQALARIIKLIRSTKGGANDEILAHVLACCRRLRMAEVPLGPLSKIQIGAARYCSNKPHSEQSYRKIARAISAACLGIKKRLPLADPSNGDS
jgi:hypothetical protein